MRILHKTLIAAVAVPLCAGISIIGAAPASADTSHPVNECVDGGPTKHDKKVADRLNDKLKKDMSGKMDDYRVSCARGVVGAVKDRGLDQHVADVAIATVIVETHLQNINVQVDHDSLGLFQQRGHWGSPSERLNVKDATNAFVDELENLYPDESYKDFAMGEVSQGVQRSAFPDRYQPMVDDAKKIVDAVWDDL